MSGTIDWRDDALCAQVDLELFFPESAEPAYPAKRVCAMCPVIEECREFAITQKIPEGIWGGTSPRERIAIRARRNRERREAA